MLKYVLFGLIVFFCYGFGNLIGTLALVVAILYTFYLNLSSFVAIKGNKAFNEGNFEEALKYYEKAYKTGRATPQICLTYGILSLRCAKPNDAVSVFNEIILGKKAKDNIKNTAKQYRTLAFYKLGQIDDAVEEAEEIFESYKNTISYGLVCYLKLATNEPIETVLPLCEEAYEYNSDDRDIVDNLAVAYIRNNNLDKAKELTDEMIEKFPAFTEAYYHGALVYSKLGNFKKAKELLDQIPQKCTRTYLTTVSEEEIKELEEKLN